MSAVAPFSCSWCGLPVSATTLEDLSAWTLLCAACLERAPGQPYLKTKLKEGLRRRAEGAQPPVGIPLAPTPATTATTEAPEVGESGVPARLGLLPPPQHPDELEAWYLNRAPYDRGPLGGATWQENSIAPCSGLTHSHMKDASWSSALGSDSGRCCSHRVERRVPTMHAKIVLSARVAD